MKNFLVLIALLLAFPLTCHAKAESNDLARVKSLFSAYVEDIGNHNRAAGNSIVCAGNFYARLLDERVNCDKARIVVVLRQPTGSSLRFLKANSDFLHQPMKTQLIWHSFVAYDGHIFDSASQAHGQSIEEYFKSVWQPLIKRPDFKLLAIQLKDLPEVAQSISNSADGIGYELVNWLQFNQNPLFISQRLNK